MDEANAILNNGEDQPDQIPGISHRGLGKMVVYGWRCMVYGGIAISVISLWKLLTLTLRSVGLFKSSAQESKNLKSD